MGDLCVYDGVLIRTIILRRDGGLLGTKTDCFARRGDFFAGNFGGGIGSKLYGAAHHARIARGRYGGDARAFCHDCARYVFGRGYVAGDVDDYDGVHPCACVCTHFRAGLALGIFVAQYFLGLVAIWFGFVCMVYAPYA